MKWGCKSLPSIYGAKGDSERNGHTMVEGEELGVDEEDWGFLAIDKEKQSVKLFSPFGIERSLCEEKLPARQRRQGP